MISAVLLGVATNVASGAGGAIAGAVMASFGKKTLAERTIDTALKAANDEIARVSGENKELRDELRGLRADIRAMKDQHDREIAGVKANHEQCEERHAELEQQILLHKQEIDRLMADKSSQPADYRSADLRRVGAKR